MSGTNIFIRRDVFDEIGGFETDPGMSGNALGYGEETRLPIEARQRVSGLKVLYEPRLLVTHLLPARKTDWSWIQKKSIIVGRCYKRLKSMNSKSCRLRKPVLFMAMGCWGTAFLVDVSPGAFLRRRCVYHYRQNYVYERSCRILSRLGGSYEVVSGSNENADTHQ